MRRLFRDPSYLIYDSAMEERNKLLRIYGPDLCAEEANAVANMMRMFSLSPLFEEDDDDASGTTESTNKVLFCGPKRLLFIGWDKRRLHVASFCQTAARPNS